ncbi:T9SS type A sorting domain-containing protein [Rubrivirga sp. IMCC45206]|uniref:T9SS type A sorting domain-containing protein n=1 Tax=Rubrivirga sp. IMCC45206 TaxID=3391614 RepID=UPI0039901E9F
MSLRLLRLALSLAVVAAPQAVRAQSPSDFDAPYERLALSETQTRVLANRRAIFLDPGRQDGTPEADPLRPLQWEVLYGQMRTAAEDVRSMPSAEALAATAATFRARRQLPIAVVWQPFDFIDQAAVDDGRLLVDESGPTPQLYRPDTDGFSAASPYQQASVFAAGALYGGDLSAALHGPVAVGATLTLVLPRNLFVVPAGWARPAFVEVLAGKRGATQTVALDQPFTVSFATPGTKWIRLTAVVGGATRHAAFQLEVREPGPARAGALESSVGASPAEACATRAVEFAWSRIVCGVTPEPSLRWRPRRRYATINDHYHGRKSADYDYGVVYSPYNFSGRLRRPIVIVGGYDSMEDAGLDDLYRQLVQFDNPETTGPVVEFDQALLEAGYDLVFMDYADSHDYIQRNGLALVDLLRRVQTEVDRNSQGEEIAGVIGYSMGGLVARYGLAYMESIGEDHGVGLFVSYDTPHQGALMPVGLETLLADLYAVLDRVLDVSALYASDADGPDFVERRLYGPALQQLLTFWAGADVNASDPRAVRTRIRRDFYDDLMAVGDYPEQLRRVAISNGNGRGRRQIKGDPNDRNGVERMQPAEQTLLVEAGLSLLWGAFGTRIELKVQNAPAPGGTAQVYRRRDVTRFLGVPIYSTAQQSTLALPNPYDIVPGSYTETYSVIRKRTGGRDTRESLLGTLAFTWLGAGAYYDVRVDAARHAFVPTASALDWNTRGGSRETLVASTFRRQDLSRSIDRTTTERRTPFDAILTADDLYFDSGVGPENQPHLFVTEGIEAFVLDQLGREAPDRSAPYIRALVTGAGSLEAGAAAAWRVHTRHGTPPFTYRWSWRYTCEPSNDPDDGAVPTSTCDETLRDGGSDDRLSATLPDHGTVLIAVSIEDAAGQMTEAFKTVSVTWAPTPEATLAPAEAARTGLPLVFAARVTPNPSRDKATLRVDLPTPADVTAEVYDTLGRLVQTTTGAYPAGSHALRVETTELGRGTYLYRVRAGAEVTSGTFTVLR